MKIRYNNELKSFEVAEQNINKIEINYGNALRNESICEGCKYKNGKALYEPCSRCIRNVGVNVDKYESEEEE